MAIYQHDEFHAFRFQLCGELVGDEVTELEHSWKTALSALRGKQVIVDVAQLTGVDDAGIDLIHQLREAGAQITASQPLLPERIAAQLGLTADPEAGQGSKKRGLLAGLFACSR